MYDITQISNPGGEFPNIDEEKAGVFIVILAVIVIIAAWFASRQSKKNRTSELKEDSISSEV